jgi:hypothetical protein
MEWTWKEAAVELNPKKWKLYRAVYDHYGQFYIEGSWPKEQFEQEAARGYGIKFIIGVRVKRNRHYYIDPVVEGPEEALRYILELIEKDKK